MRAGVRILMTALLGGLAAPGPAAADSGPFTANPRLGRGGVSTPVRVELADGSTWLQVGKARVDLGLGSQPNVTIEEVELVGGGRVAVLRAKADDAEAGAIVSRPRGTRGAVLWSGRLTPHGDPGERITHRIEVADRDGDGKPDVLLGETFERARLCGQRDTLLNPRAIDPRTLKLRRVSIDRLAAAQLESAIDVTAELVAVGATQTPDMRLLLPVAASSTRGTSGPSVAGPPFALADGDATTAWHEGGAGGGRGEFVTLRWDSEQWPLRAITLSFAGVTGEAVAPPVESIALLADGGLQYRVAIPTTPAQAPARYRITLPQPAKTRCLSLVFPQPARAGATLGLAEVQGHGGFAEGGGISALVKELSGSGPRASEAARLLSRGGEPALEALAAGWPTMTRDARLRGLRVAQAMATQPTAVELLASAAQDSDATVRDAALEGLVKAGDAGAEARAAVLATQGLGDRLAIQLARRGGVAELDALLGAMVGPADAARTDLREALAISVRRLGAAGAQRLDQWRSDPHPAEIRAAVAQAVSQVEVAAPSVAALVSEGLSPDLEFEPLWRFVRASGALDSQPDVDARLASLARDDERWMMRAEALSSLAARRGTALEEVARALLLDPYPRVRAVAVRSLAALGAATGALTKHARRDRWFLVRVAALGSMGATAAERDAMREAVDDRAPVVRTAAIVALQRIADARGWSVVEPHVSNDSEDPQVIGAGVSFASALCIKKASPALRAVVERGLKPDAWDPDRELALHGLLALQHIDGRASIEPLLRRAGPEVRRALEGGPGIDESGGCGGKK